jgi:hypothetical protein
LGARSVVDLVGTKFFLYSPEELRPTEGLKVDFTGLRFHL